MGLYILKFPYRKILLPFAKKFIFVDPDILGYCAALLSLVTGVCLYFAYKIPWFLLMAILLTFARMTLNTIDGVIAIEQKKDTLVGEIVNALPDRYSDVFFLVGIAISPLCNNIIGILATCSVFLVSYTGMLGKAVSVEWQHQGPLGKVERLILLMAFSFIQYMLMTNGTTQILLFGLSFTAIEWCMLLYIVLGQVTVLNRLNGQLTQIRKLEWDKKEKFTAFKGKVLVVYDSMTGNTEKVAVQIAQCFRADLKKIQEVIDINSYDFVIIGTPNIRKYPMKSIMEFTEQFAKTIKPYAVFLTWGMPVWGPISARACFKYFTKATGRKPIGMFSCKGFHAKYKKYPGHPTEKELFGAYLFAISLARKLGVK